uniref:Serpin domain-containing protein n=1 Tax=Myotis myotis TaxID=51298 RepID=A0A7J7ZYC6_MYOMY|nr:hypothetical protein mMyoMyo1_009917 [Myotis myotis]
MSTRASRRSSLRLTGLARSTCLELPTGSSEKSPLISTYLSKIPASNSTKQRWKSLTSSKLQRRLENINIWVANKTEGKITELLPPNSVNQSTPLVLVNAIYFKGNWDSQFSKHQTQERPFKVSKNEQKPLQMMFKKSTFNMTYVGEIFTKILVLPYVGKELNMIIMLPDEYVDLETVEKQLTYEKFVEWIRPDMMDEEEVEVCLPRFQTG